MSRYIKLAREIRSSNAKTVPTLKQGLKIKLKDLGIIEDDRTYEDGSKAIDYVDSADISSGNEFLFVNLMDAHGPYIAPPDYRTVEPADMSSMELITSGESTEISGEGMKPAYEDCVRHLSDIYSDLHERLTEKFDYVITMADHGEAFGEYGMWGHTGLGPEVTNIPLSIHTPEDENDLSPTEQPVNLHDIFQTVLDLADVEAPDGTRGASLFSDCVHEHRLKLLETHGLSGEKLDGLRDDGYDQETIDRYDQRLHAVATETGYAFETFDGTIEYVGEKIPDAKSKMESLASSIERREDADAVDISDEVHDRLEELGYA
ncbi:sulfatase-like hydrolase/transferase [Halorubrum saccharovorum]|uniref:sulfatase-like hydrolase/transferase n=1 Tax=Halorubrum saccharovorum TaxID=2248 RepID=UPI0019101AC3|nr:sulfatase-like hydrolase/transferase [Halorubrum saccharovorum]